MKRKILCFFGLHRWRWYGVRIGADPEWSAILRCFDCGAIKRAKDGDEPCYPDGDDE